MSLDGGGFTEYGANQPVDVASVHIHDGPYAGQTLRMVWPGNVNPTDKVGETVELIEAKKGPNCFSAMVGPA